LLVVVNTLQSVFCTIKCTETTRQRARRTVDAFEKPHINTLTSAKVQHC